MRPLFEELDRQATAKGEISLRRRFDPSLEVEVHEVRLDEEFLMSSLFTVAEEALADLTLAAVEGDGLDVVVGGLGLGCTAHAALGDARVRSVVVIDAAAPVIAWHRAGLVPLGGAIAGSARCELVLGDFFELAAPHGPDGALPIGGCDAVLLDVDHSPDRHLDPGHAPFYEPEGLAEMARRIRPGGAFGLWSDDPPDDDFLADLATAFATTAAHVVEFPNPYTGGTSANTVYVATSPRP